MLDDNFFAHRQLSSNSRDRIVVSTSRCGRDNPGSNPGHGISSCGVCVMAQLSKIFFFVSILFTMKSLNINSKSRYYYSYY